MVIRQGRIVLCHAALGDFAFKKDAFFTEVIEAREGLRSRPLLPVLSCMVHVANLDECASNGGRIVHYATAPERQVAPPQVVSVGDADGGLLVVRCKSGSAKP